MFDRFVRFTMVMSFALASLITVAGAQAKSTMPPPAPKENPIVTMPANPHGGVLVKMGKDGSILPDNWTSGWNYFHVANCTSYYWSGSWLVVMYFQEGPYAYSYDPNAQALLYPACQTGNWIAFYAYDNNGDWDQIWTYNYN